MVLAAVSILVAGLPLAPAAQASSSASGFTVASAIWGTAANPVEAAPGTQNDPLTISLQYNYYNTAQGISVTLNLPTGFTDTNGNPVVTAYYAAQVPSGTVISLTFNLDIGSGAALGTYAFPMTISWGAVVSTYPQQSVSEVQSTYATVSLRGRVQLQFSAGQPTLSPGQVNQIPIVITNSGTGNATNVLLSISATSTLLSSGPVSVLNTPPEIFLIKANSTTKTTVSIYAPQSLAGSSISLAIGGTYSDSYGNTRTISATVGVYVQSTASAPITVVAKSLQLTPGAVNNVTLVVTNVGKEAFTQMQVNVVVPPSVSLLRQFPVTVSGLEAGSSTEVGMPIFVSAALSGSPITIPATVTYTDAAGGTGSTTQNLGFYVPVAQSPSIGLSGYSYNPSLIFPGMTVASLQVVIYNSGTTPGSNLNVTLFPSDPVYSITKGSLSQSVGLIPVGQSIPFTFTIGILNSSEPMNTTLTLHIASAGVAPQQFGIPFVEQPRANFKVVSVSAPQVASGDGADQVTISLRNEGGAAAQLATFTMQPSYVFEPSTSGSFTTPLAAGAGTIAPGASTNLVVVVQVNSNIQSGSYPLIFRATWTQLGSTQPFSQDITLMIPVSLSVFQIVNGAIFSLPFLGAVVVLIVAFVLFRRARSRRRPTEAQSKP